MGQIRLRYHPLMCIYVPIRESDQDFARRLIDTLFIHIGTLPFQFDSCMAECQGGELTNAVLYAGGDDEIFRSIMLQDQPHTLDIILRITPVSERREVSKIQLFLLPLCEPHHEGVLEMRSDHYGHVRCGCRPGTSAYDRGLVQQLP